MSAVFKRQLGSQPTNDQQSCISKEKGYEMSWVVERKGEAYTVWGSGREAGGGRRRLTCTEYLIRTSENQLSIMAGDIHSLEESRNSLLYTHTAIGPLLSCLLDNGCKLLKNKTKQKRGTSLSAITQWGIFIGNRLWLIRLFFPHTDLTNSSL